MQGTATIVNKLKQGDEQAFRTMYERYHPELYRYSMKFVRADEAAKEMVQNVFIQVWRNRRKLNPGLSFQAYLFKIARNENFKYLKLITHETLSRQELSRHALATYMPVRNDDVFDEYQLIGRKAIEQLPPKRRLVFEMVQEGLTHEEVARELGISIHTVRSQLLKGTLAVKQYLSRYLGIVLS